MITTVKKTIGLLAIAFAIYFLVGAVLPFIRQKDMSRESLQFLDSKKNEAKYYSGEEKALIIDDNRESYQYKLNMIRSAEETIDLASFYFFDSKAGRNLAAALVEASERGVKVRVLVDGFSDLLMIRKQGIFQVLSDSPNIELKYYNPIKPLEPWTINGRMHDKYLLVDKKIYTLGGRNIADEYLGTEGASQKIDWDVLVISPGGSKDSSAIRLGNYFEGIWNDRYTKASSVSPRQRDRRIYREAKIDLKERRDSFDENFSPRDFLSRLNQEATGVDRVRLLTNPTTPYGKEPYVFYQITDLMKSAKNEVYIHTPYIITNKRMEDRLKELYQGEAKITMMTNSIANNSNTFGATDYKFRKKKILRTGVNILDFDGGRTYHGKCFTIDDHISSIGAYNWDMRSTYIDTETMVVIEGRKFNQEMREKMKTYEDQSLVVVDKNKSLPPAGHKPQEVKPIKKIKMALAGLGRIFVRFLL